MLSNGCKKGPRPPYSPLRQGAFGLSPQLVPKTTIHIQNLQILTAGTDSGASRPFLTDFGPPSCRLPPAQLS